MKKLIPLTFVTFLILGVAQSADAFRIGPRLGFVNEEYQDPCLDAEEWNLFSYINFEKSPDKDCKVGNCGQPYYGYPAYQPYGYGGMQYRR